MIIVKISLILVACGLAGALVQIVLMDGRQDDWSYIFSYLEEDARANLMRRQSEEAAREKELFMQSQCPFSLDFMVYHGDAFGGCAATLSDGKIRRGRVRLDEIPIHGRHPSGGDYIYYIEDQGIEICACESEGELRIHSVNAEFDIREEGMNRDQGARVYDAVIHRDIIYYIVLESRHEIAVRATGRC